MYNWLYFISSNREFHKLMGYILEEEGISGVTYLVFSEELKCDDGRIFVKSNGFLIVVNFFTHTTSFKDNMVKSGLNLASLVDLYEIVCEDKNPSTQGITITNKAERIIFDKDFENFLRKNHFKFRDGSSLTMPKVNSNYRL